MNAKHTHMSLAILLMLFMGYQLNLLNLTNWLNNWHFAFWSL